MISPDRIMGFIEGEGCFGVAIERENDKRPRKTERKNILKKESFGFRIRPSFRISLAAKDRKMLDEMCQYLTVGYVYAVRNPGGRSDVVQYAVQAISDLKTLILFFDAQEFLTTKGDSYQKWRQIVGMVSRGEHLTKEGFLKICSLREGMNLVHNKEKRLRPTSLLEPIICEAMRADDRGLSN